MAQQHVILGLRNINLYFIKLKNEYKNYKSLEINELMMPKICC